MAKEKINVVRIDTDPAKKSLKDLRKEILELKNEMANLDEDSDAFSKLAAKAGNLKHQIDEINQRVKGSSSDWGDMVGNISKVAAGITGAFQAVAGGLQAMGMESEALDKTIARMQGLMAVTQGLSTIDEAIDGFKDLTASIDGTTKAGKALKVVLQPKVLLAIAAVITSIVLAFKNWEGAIRDALPFVDKICNAFGRVHPDIKKATEEQEKFNAKIREQYEIMKTEQQKISDEADRIRLNRRMEVLTEDAKAKLKKAQEDLILSQDNYNEALMKRTEVVMSGDAFALKVLDAQLKAYTTSIEKNKTLIESILKDDKWVKKESEVTDELKKNYDDEVKTIEHLIELYKKLYGEDSVAFKKEELNLAERSLANIKSYFGETSKEYETQLRLVLDLRKALEELTEVKEEPVDEKKEKLEQLAESWKKAIQTPQEWYDQELANLNALKDAKLLTDKEYIRAKKQLDQELADWEKDLNQKLADDKKEKMMLTLQVISSGFNAIGSIMSELANNENAETKESFEKQKKLQIGAATMSMLTGIINAWTSAMALPSPFNFIQGGIDIAATAALGAIQINKIKQQQFGGTGSTPGTSSAATAAMIVPPVQYSSAVQGANTEGAIRDSKVYVTETDIKNTMNKVSVQENENIY